MGATRNQVRVFVYWYNRGRADGMAGREMALPDDDERAAAYRQGYEAGLRMYQSRLSWRF